MSYDELLTTASMTSLYCKCLHQALILLFKCLNGTGPTYIGSLFKYRRTPYRLRVEGLNLELPNFNLKFKKNSFTYSLSYGVCHLKCVFQVMLMTSEVNCTTVAFQNVSYSAQLQLLTIFRTSIIVFLVVFSMRLFSRFQLFIFYVFITKFFICIYLLSCF